MSCAVCGEDHEPASRCDMTRAWTCRFCGWEMNSWRRSECMGCHKHRRRDEADAGEYTEDEKKLLRDAMPEESIDPKTIESAKTVALARDVAQRSAQLAKIAESLAIGKRQLQADADRAKAEAKQMQGELELVKQGREALDLELKQIRAGFEQQVAELNNVHEQRGELDEQCKKLTAKNVDLNLELSGFDAAMKTQKVAMKQHQDEKAKLIEQANGHRAQRDGFAKELRREKDQRAVEVDQLRRDLTKAHRAVRWHSSASTVLLIGTVVQLLVWLGLHLNQ